MTLSTEFSLKINGTELAAEVRGLLLEVSVDQHVHLPAMFLIRLADAGLAQLDGTIFELGKEVEIAAGGEGGSSAVLLIKGEITSLEPAFNEGMVAELVVRGYDKAHRLTRETKSKAHLNKKDSDLAQEIAQTVGLQAEVETTPTVYEHLFQNNQTDLAFLQERAWRIGYECFVEREKLYFRKPPQGGEAVELSWGSELLTFHPRMTLAEQVDEVIVKGWDVENQRAIIGRAGASEAHLAPQIGESQRGDQLASPFGRGKRVVVNQPVVSQAEANDLAKARLNEIAGAFIEAEGVAFRKPEVRAGKMVQLAGLGRKLSGRYLVTSVTHRYTPAGLQSDFAVRGSRTGLISEIMEGGESRNSRRWGGVYVGIVTNSADPQNWGRVKVQFPWLSDEGESWWARVIGAGAGDHAGLFFIPQVGDEVIVAFEQGEFNSPVVIGGVWNGQKALPNEAGTGDEQPKTRIWQSPSGHTISTFDTDQNKIELKTAGGHLFTLDDANQKIVLKTKGGNELVIDDNGREIKLTGTGQLNVETSQSVKIETMSAEIKSSGPLKLSGATIDIEAQGPVTIKGAVVNLN